MERKGFVPEGLTKRKRSKKNITLEDRELLEDAMKQALKHQKRLKNGSGLHFND